MSSVDIFLLVISFACLLIILWTFRKSRHFFKSLFLSAVSGIGGLCFVNLISEFTAVTLALNPFTVVFSAFSGLSGVIAMLILKLL